MPIRIIPGNMSHLPACQDILLHSVIGRRYFTEPGRAERFLSDGFAKREIYVAVGEREECLGYIWFTLDGAFYSYPYVRNLIVGEAVRGLGVGTALLDYFHERGFAGANCVFLTVSDFNLQAQRFYEANGYVGVGLLPDLILPGVSERIMMKRCAPFHNPPEPIKD